MQFCHCHGWVSLLCHSAFGFCQNAIMKPGYTARMPSLTIIPLTFFNLQSFAAAPTPPPFFNLQSSAAPVPPSSLRCPIPFLTLFLSPSRRPQGTAVSLPPPRAHAGPAAPFGLEQMSSHRHRIGRPGLTVTRGRCRRRRHEGSSTVVAMVWGHCGQSLDAAGRFAWSFLATSHDHRQ